MQKEEASLVIMEQRTEGMSYSRRVQVTNLDPEVTWAKVKEFMSAAGKVLKLELLKDDRGKCKGALVDFECQLEALRALQQLEGAELVGRKVTLKEEAEPSRSRSPRRRKSPTGTQVFVGNLHYSVTWQQLRDVFRTYGPVLGAYIPRTRDSRSRGYGFITFESSSDAQRAIEKLNDTELNGRRISVRLQRS